MDWDVIGIDADADDFENGVLPSGQVTFAIDETEKTETFFIDGFPAPPSQFYRVIEE